MIAYDLRLSSKNDANFDVQISAVLRELGTRINLLSHGALAGIRGIATAAPTTGTWAKGDVVRNSAPAEAGGAGSKYVIYGWICSAAGTPGTWLQIRTLTGN